MRNFLWAAAFVAGCGAPEAPPGPGEDLHARTATPGIEDAIARLGDENWIVRRDAADELLAAGRASLPYLKEAEKSPDPEVSNRANSLAAEIEQEPLVWVGIEDDRWENPENWTPKQSPGAWSTAIVPQATDPLFDPVIRGEVSVRDLVLLRNSKLTIEEGAVLHVTGRLRSRGTLDAKGEVQGAD
jgi:hypothetical protein